METMTDSNEILSCGGSSCVSYVSNTESEHPEFLNLLSLNISSIFQTQDSFSDAKISDTGGREVFVHRCILSSRSPLFKRVFKGERKSEFELTELVKGFKVGFDALLSVLGYLYSGKVGSFMNNDVSACVNEYCCHVACRPAVDFVVELLYLSCTFEISELVGVYQRHLLNILHKVATDDILVILTVVDKCGQACKNLLARCTEIIVRSDADIVTLEKALPQHLVKQITDSRLEFGLSRPEDNSFPDIHMRRIHGALDSDDVELVRMLLNEGHTTLDDAYAVHYAVAYCDAKTATELLELELADVNLRNLRGHTVLHMAAMRKEPKIIVSLLTKGAQPSDLTLDGQNALQISKSLTRAVDYWKPTEEGKDSPKDRLCIEVLEQAERRAPLLGEAFDSLSLAEEGDVVRAKLLYLENRVGLAKLLFPVEAQVAMDIARVHGTFEFPSTGVLFNSLPSSQRTTVDLKEVPLRIQEEHLDRMRALSRTVELGKHFFPRCSEVLNKIVDSDDLSELALLKNGTPEEQRLKKRRYEEIQELLSKAFHDDKEEFDKSTIFSSSTSLGMMRPKLKLTTKKMKC